MPRSLVAARVLAAATSLEEYVDARYEPVWEDTSMETADPVSSGGVIEWTTATTLGPVVTRWARLADDRLELVWRWDPTAFADDALFAPELSLACPVSLTLEPDAESWRYAIVTVSKCPDGFEEIEQGWSVTLRWPIALGRAKVTLRPVE
jgi:hypothetical protein